MSIAITTNPGPDPGAAFAASLSVYEACELESTGGNSNHYIHYDGGGVGFYQEVARVGRLFEEWASEHVDFDELGECWPYFVQEYFGEAVLDYMGAGELMNFNEQSCAIVANTLHLPLR